MFSLPLRNWQVFPQAVPVLLFYGIGACLKKNRAVRRSLPGIKAEAAFQSFFKLP